jgi:hypothetical protein
MRYLVAVITPWVLRQVERSIGPERIRVLKPGESNEVLGIERFTATVVERCSPVEIIDPDLPVLLTMQLERSAIERFRTLAEAGLDVRVWPLDEELSEPMVHLLSGPRSPSPAAAIVRELRGMFTGLAADVLTAAAILGDERRSIEQIAGACHASPVAIRNVLRDNNLPSITSLIAQMRCLHALWAWEIGQQANFWSAAGFTTLAEASQFMSDNTGAPVGRWKIPAGFTTLLREFAASCEPAKPTSCRMVG